RWHISLTQWIRDYLYRPLRRNGHMGRLPSVLLVFTIMGLWHGANWTFVVWGILNALFLIVEISTYSPRQRLFATLGLTSRAIGLMGWAAAFGFMVLSLIFFRAPSLGEAILYFKNLFIIPNLHVNIPDYYFELVLSLRLILGVQSVHYDKGNNGFYGLIEDVPRWRRWSIYVIYIVLIVLFGRNRQQNFIYFQF